MREFALLDKGLPAVVVDFVCAADFLAASRLLPAVVPLIVAECAIGDLIPSHSIYQSLQLRINLLTRFAQALTQLLKANSNVALQHYTLQTHLWLDAHWLLQCAADDLLAFSGEARALADDCSEWQAAIREYAPSPRTIFHDGELPDLMEDLAHCAFLGELCPARTNPFTNLFSKVVPLRSKVRDMMPSIEALSNQRSGAVNMLAAIYAASLLGVYPQASERPLGAFRKRCYYFFFYEPPPAWPPLLLTYSVARFQLLFASTQEPATVRKIGGGSASKQQKPTDSDTGTSIREGRHRLWLAWLDRMWPSSRTRRRMIKKHVSQDVTFHVLREFVINHLYYLPAVHDSLIEQHNWRKWETTVIAAMDATRRYLDGAPTDNFLGNLENVPCSSQSAFSIFHRHNEKTFAECLLAAMATGLTTAAIANAPLDHICPIEYDVVMRYLVSHCGYRPGCELIPSLANDFAGAHDGFFPLRLFGASTFAISEYLVLREAHGPGNAEAIGCFIGRLAQESMFQYHLLMTFTQVVVDHARHYAFPLPAYLADQQIAALRSTLGVAKDEPLPRHLLRTYTCSRCHRFCGSLVTKKTPFAINSSGSEFVSVATDCDDSWVLRSLRDRHFRLLTPAELPSWPSSHEYYKTMTSAHHHELCVFPPRPGLDDSPPGALEEAERFLLARQQDTADCASALLTPLAAPTDEPPLPPSTLNSSKSATEADDLVSVELCDEEDWMSLEKDFAAEWNGLTAQSMTIGHWSPLSEEQRRQMIWVCDSPRHKFKAKKIKTGNDRGGATSRMLGALTPREVRTTKVEAEDKRRKDMLSCYQYSLCKRTRLLEVGLLGMGLRFDKTVIVACCRCLSYVTMADAVWFGKSLECGRCRRDDFGGGMAAQLSASLRCRFCGWAQKPGEFYYECLIYDDTNVGSERFANIYFCEKHLRDASWIFAAPNIQPLSVVDYGLRKKWGLRSEWNPEKDYLGEMNRGESAGANEDDLMPDLTRTKARKIGGAGCGNLLFGN